MDMKRPSLQQKLVRLRARMHDPEWRRYGKLLLAGKLLGVGLLLGVVLLSPELIGWKTLAADTEL